MRNEPIEKAVLDALGGAARRIEVWQFVRARVVEFSANRTPELRTQLNALMREVACDLAEDVEHILPASHYKTLWDGSPWGHLINPMELCVTADGRIGLRRHAGRYEVDDTELVRFVRVADAVLQRLRASVEGDHATESGDKAGDPLRAVRTADGRRLLPAVVQMIVACPAKSLQHLASKADLNGATVRAHSRPMQEANLLRKLADGSWATTDLALGLVDAEGRSTDVGSSTSTEGSL